MEAYKAKFGAEANIQSVAGYNVIMVTAEGLKNAGRNLTVDSFVEGLHTISGYTDMFGSAPIAFSRDHHLATRTAFVAQIRNGRWAKVTEHLSY
jgi:branched-chain amino acid transport system substrate-binding protein